MLQKKDIGKSKIYSVLVLEHFASERNLGRLVKFLEAFFLIFVIVALGTSLFIVRMNIPNATELSHLIEYKLLGILSLVMALIAIVSMLRAYLRSSYYFENVLHNRYHPADLYTFTVGRILYRTPGDDWLAGFMRSDTGRLILARCGISSEQISDFLDSRAAQPLEIGLSPVTLLKLRDFVLALYRANADFSKLLYAAGIGEADFLAVVDWVVKGIEANEMSQRFWRKENLDRISSLGKEWSYGYTPMLDQFATDLLDRPEAQYSAYEVNFREKEVKQLEGVLARQTGANALLVGDNEPVRLDVLWSGSQVFSLLDPYFASSSLSVIAMSDTDKFHRTLETRGEVMARFERVSVPELSAEEAIANLLSSIDRIERGSHIEFSYQGLKQVVHSAEAYLSEGSLTDKARDLLEELVPWAGQNGIKFILPQTVSDYISQKTKIPSGEITEQEKKILQNLESALHERVIGQPAAIKAVASAMKRARVGVVNQKRPLGSFLFLGPTGVGKTETAKALAFAYFGTEDKLMRLDMTEYQDEGAVETLIGSFGGNKPGVLANMIRQNVFGVLLLDEFEKTNKDVLNLFLQILDEGFFSDMNGKKVNARNIIFIATSNAGAETIWRMLKEGKDPSTNRDALINEIVQTGIYRPELINRFDDVIIFHPLSADELFQIAGLMLKKLAKRLEPKGINLVVNEYLARKVASEGANEMFGARPMNRYIQDKAEEAIADQIIAGSVGPGKSVEFRAPVAGSAEEFEIIVQ
ncbi:MAG: AAA family ATPase [Candidatus Vogelbacteria bacterium]|nr:AAA family ATPase [Candidatus Vogelbacteria bacterium]